jgi:hypothetical protein
MPNAMSGGDKKDNLEKNILETLSSKWNGPAFQVKKQCKDEEKRVLKGWQMVEGYWQLNRAIKDDTFKTRSVSEP